MTPKNDDARAERLKAALRENLRRRKAQIRGRAEPDPGKAPSDRPADRLDPCDEAGADAP